MNLQEAKNKASYEANQKKIPFVVFKGGKGDYHIAQASLFTGKAVETIKPIKNEPKPETKTKSTKVQSV